MKKLLKPMSVVFAAAAMMASCTNDDELNPGNNNSGAENQGPSAYITVNIKDADNVMSRATGSEVTPAGDYKNGSADEHLVNSAKFYFFDKRGTFVQEASVWDGGKDNGGHGENGYNVEYIGKNVVVLKGLTETNYPVYMLTVLNVPTDFKVAQGATLDDVRKQISAIKIANANKDKASNHENANPDSVMVMSTSSYLDADLKVDGSSVDPYGVTILKTENFNKLEYGEEIPADAADRLNPVTVYVERLAAKVEVALGSSLSAEGGNPFVNGGYTYFPLNVSVAGNGNNEGNPEGLGVTTVYVRLTNWGINATAKESYITKNISDFTDDKPFANWNNKNYFRSFWGKSVVYGQDIVTDATAETPATLNYIKYNQAKKAWGAFDYCPENTNTAEKIIALSNTADVNKTTSVVFAAEVCEKVTGDNGNVSYQPLDMVRFHGELFRTSAFYAYALTTLNTRHLLNYYKPADGTTIADDVDKITEEDVAAGTYEFEQMNADDLGLILAPAGQGLGSVFVSAAPKNNEFWAKEGNTFVRKYFVVNKNETELNNLKKDLKAFDIDSNIEGGPTASLATSFNGGKMVYSVPVQHILERKPANADIVEGNYGVVRNHWYRLTVNSINNLGHAVFNPDAEDIIIKDDKDPTYYVGAVINILSWRIVDQKVDL